MSDSYFELNIENPWSEMSVPMGQDTSHRSSTPLPTTPFPYEEGNHSPSFKPSNLFHLEENLSKTFPENSSVTFETSKDERNPKWDSLESESHVHQVPHPSNLEALLAIHQQFYEIYR